MALEINVERARALYSVDTVRGVLVRKVDTGRHGRHKAGTVAGNKPVVDGYGQAMIDGINYMTHRIVFAIVHGWCPEGVDHKDTDRMNNRPDNLRAATDTENKWNRGVQANSTSGTKGLSYDNGSWLGRVTKNGKVYRKRSISRGAVEQWLLETRAQLHGEFARNNKENYIGFES